MDTALWSLASVSSYPCFTLGELKPEAYGLTPIHLLSHPCAYLLYEPTAPSELKMNDNINRDSYDPITRPPLLLEPRMDDFSDVACIYGALGF